MPSEANLQKKIAAVADVEAKMKNSVAGVIVDYKGISVEKDSQMRRELREAGVEYAVIKNRILTRACENVGFEELQSVLAGPTAIAVSEDDPVAAAKILAKYSSELKDHFVIKAGFVDGRVINAEEVEVLAKLPSREELIAKAMGSLNAPISGLVNVLNGNIRGLAIALGQILEQKQA